MATTQPGLHGLPQKPQSFSAKAEVGKGVGPFTQVHLGGLPGRRQTFVAKTVPQDLYIQFPPFEFGYTADMTFEGTEVDRNRRLYRLLGGYRR